MFSHSLSAPPKSREVTFTINQIRMAQKLISASLFSPLMVLLRQVEMSFPLSSPGDGCEEDDKGHTEGGCSITAVPWLAALGDH